MVILYPPAFDDEGGVMVPHIPTNKEREGCVFAKRAMVSCLRQKPGTDKINDRITCLNCFINPLRPKALKDRFFFKAKCHQPITR